MTRKHRTHPGVLRGLRPSPDRFAAAAALQDPALLLGLQAAQSQGERPASPPPPSTPQQRPSDLRSPSGLR